MVTTWTWVKLHPGWTILIALATVLALWMVASIIFNSGGTEIETGETLVGALR